ncbi:MAG: hypothetical protein H7256_10900 [Bdellovibrio sp.]|nr:hypothetical protein [Bdellovibrio sp.]
MMTKTQSLVLFCIAAGLTACQTMPYQPYARDVKKKPGQNGVIALRLDNRDEDKAKARQMMSSNCGAAAVKVLEEGEVVVGQETKGTADTTKSKAVPGAQVGSLWGIPLTSGGRDAQDSTQSSSVTTSVKEWQMSYECEIASTSKKR